MTSFGVTKDQIFKACENLIKKEINLTVANVREYLGTGSYSTLTPVIKDFKNRLRGNKRDLDEVPPIPIQFEKKFNSQLQDMWSTLSEYYLEEIKLMKNEFSLKIEEVQTALNSKNEEYEQMLKDLQKYEETISVLKKQLSSPKKSSNTKKRSNS